MTKNRESIIESALSDLLYSSRVRYFLKKGAFTLYFRGFRTKKDAERYINMIPNLDWRVGFLFRRFGDDFDTEIVTRKGSRI